MFSVGFTVINGIIIEIISECSKEFTPPPLVRKSVEIVKHNKAFYSFIDTMDADTRQINYLD